MVAWSPACSRGLVLPLPPFSIQPGSSSSNEKLFRNTAEQEKVDTHTLATMEARVQPLSQAFTAGSEPSGPLLQVLSSSCSSIHIYLCSASGSSAYLWALLTPGPSKASPWLSSIQLGRFADAHEKVLNVPREPGSEKTWARGDQTDSGCPI